ncbi:MAG: trehalose-6-phosphate synthase [Bacillota bacterium]
MQSALNPIRQTGSLVVVSNRASYVFTGNREQITWKRAVSGLVSAVEPVLNSFNGTWVAWCGRLNNGHARGMKIAVPAGSPRYTLQEVTLDEEEYNGYYHGFANSSLWPLAHQMIDKCAFKQEYWQAYRQVNHKFARAVVDSATEESIFWVHDYHLTIVPQLIRRRYPQSKIAFFWHIPFPPPDIFGVLPWARQVLHGLLGSDLIAFHTRSYLENFLACVKKYFRLQVNLEHGLVWSGNRRIIARAIPVGINWQRFEQLANDPEVKAQARRIRRAAGAEHLLLGIDRLDYTKGISERIKAFGAFLEKYPQYQGRATLLQVAVPTRNGVEAYARLKEEVERLVGEINGLYDRGYGAVPVRYLHRSLNEKELVAHYLAADVLLVTALRDGLNLIAKEFIAARTDGQGVLLLSPFAGAAEELKSAVLANPYNLNQLANRMKVALEMPPEEKQERLRTLQQVVKNKDSRWWWQTHLKLIALPQGRLTPEKHIAANQTAT